MVRRILLVLVVGLAVASLPWLTAAPSSAEDERGARELRAGEDDRSEKPGARERAQKALMRSKLAASQHILEGLAMEDFDLVAKGAKQLKAISVAAEFMVLDDPVYADQADEFRRAVGRMSKAAGEKSIDAATLSFMDTTLSCVECHKFVRSVPAPR